MNYELINEEAQKFAQAYKHKVAAETGFYHGVIWAAWHMDEIQHKGMIEYTISRKAKITQTAADWLSMHPCKGTQDNICRAFEAGAEWADEHPKAPWRDAKYDPPKDSNVVVAIFADSHLEKWLCNYNTEEKIWALDDYICDAPRYWMPIPELPKGGEQ